MYLAVDIGGTKTLLGVFDAKGKLEQTHRFKTDKNYKTFLKDLRQAVAKLTTKKFTATAVGVAGRLDRQAGIVMVLGNLPWENVPLTTDVEDVVDAPVVLENDSKLAGLYEGQLFKDSYRKVLYVTVGTGISSALVVNGKLDPNLIDSEAGKMLLEHDGKLTRWEDFASGRAIVEHFGKRAEDLTKSEDWYVVARNLALGLNDLIATTNPDVVVIGGGIGQYFQKFKVPLQNELETYASPMFSIPPIVQAKDADTAVIYGGYRLLKARYG